MTSPSRRTPPPTNRSRASRAYRAAPQRSFLERNRSRLLWGLAGVALVAIASMAFLNATSPAYACSTEWEPAVTPEPAPGATPRLGYVQNDLGRDHTPSVGQFVRYALCPPASGRHFNAQGEGPIRPGVFGPDDQANPQGWIHNLEHGGLVVLYRCEDGDSGCSEAAQDAMQAFYASFPNSPICDIPAGAGGVGPIIARFDQMKWPYAALLWGQVLPLDAFDTQLILDFFAQQGERSNPEALCAAPTPTPGPTGSPAPSDSGSPSPSGSADASGSPAPSSTPVGEPTDSPAPSPTPAAS